MITPTAGVNILKGRRVHIAGSISKSCPQEHAVYAHALVAKLAKGLTRLGATFVVPIDAEPLLPECPEPISVTFDWTVLEAVWQSRGERPSFEGLPDRHLVHAVMHAKNTHQIPERHVALWDEVLSAGGSGLSDLTDIGDWNVGAMRREAQAQLGDLLIVIGGSEGVAHLANLYHEAGKPVIPLDLPLGWPYQGAEFLSRQAAQHPQTFFRTKRGVSGSALYKRITLAQLPAVEETAGRITELVMKLEGPTAFFVRLLNRTVDPNLFEQVDYYLTQIVEPLVVSAGYEPLTIGVNASEEAFINTEIFNRLHRSQLVIVDLTGLRPNCFLELGYALARQLPTLVLIKEDPDKKPPFDITTLPTHAWNPTTKDVPAKEAFMTFWQQQANRKPVVEPKRLL